MNIETVSQYQALFEHSSDIITLINEEGVIRFESPSVEDVLGYGHGQLIDENAFEYIHSDDREHVIETFESTVDSSGTVTDRVEYRFRHADGSWIWLESITSNQMATAIDGYIINSRDISKRKQYEIQLENRTEELEALNRIVRHDIRNDMSIILGWAQMLDDHVDETGQDYLQNILASGNHIVELTEIVRDYVEMLTGETKLAVEPTSLRYILKTEITLRQESHPEAEFIIPEEIPDIEVIANDLLGSVFRNLLTNAVQHNNRETPVIEISCERRDEDVIVCITDNGPGIPDEQKESIFGKGEKGLESPGTGIGLYLVRTLIEQYDGRVWIEDNDLTGAVFNIQLRKVNPD